MSKDEVSPDPLDLAALDAEVNRIVAASQALPVTQRLRFLKGEVAKLPKEMRRPAETLVLGTEVMVDESRRTVERWVAGICTIVFILLMLAIAFFQPNPTASQQTTYSLVLAVIAGVVGWVLPGELHIEGKVESFSLRAAGAIALFVLVYLVSQGIIGGG